MSLAPTSSEATQVPDDRYVVSPSDVLEYAFCPRFIYYMNVMRIPQRQEKRYKVRRGRQVHTTRALRSADYLRKGIGCVEKEVEVELYSAELGMRGIVDEVLTLDDGSMAPLDYKWAEWKGTVYRTYRLQAALYALLIAENYDVVVERAFLVYTRTGSTVRELEITEELCDDARDTVGKIREITETGMFPPPTSSAGACADCCYRNICPGRVPA